MGLSSSTTRTVNTPSPQQTQAGNTLNSVFQQQLPRVQGYADQIGSLIPHMMDRFNQGDAGVNSARDWITQTLGQQGENPLLQQMIDQTGGDISRQVGAGMGSRGNWGGSVHEKMLANALARNSLGTRYDDYNRQREMQARAAGMAPGVAAADTIQIAPLLAASQYAGGAPMDAVSRYASGVGGLFGNTGTQSTTQSPSLFGTILGALAAGGRAAAGGG